MKKILKYLVIMIMVLVSFSEAKAEDNIITYGRISPVMPDVTAEIKGNSYKKEDISAFFGTETLTVEDVHIYDKSSDSTCVYALVDLSTSMKKSFEDVKKNLIHYIELMGDNDEIVIVTFGKNEVAMPLTGNETKEEIINIVSNLQCDQKGTLFYEALSKAYQLSNASVKEFDREYVLAFSDGIDVQKGSTTYEEMTALYKSHSLPIYAYCSPNTSKEASDKFGELARTSGGIIAISSKRSFDDFLTEVNDVTLIKMKASNNHADGSQRQLSVKIGDSQIEHNVPVTRSVPDNEAPEIKEVYYDEEKDSIIIIFSEETINADKVESYKITDEKENELTITSVAKYSKENSYEIKTENKILNQKYVISVDGITDNSQEQNTLTASKELMVENSKNKDSIPTWIIILIAAIVVVLVVVVILIVVLSRKKKNVSASEEIAVSEKRTDIVVEHIETNKQRIQHHIKAENAVRVKMKVKTGKTLEQTIDITITASVIVGRSSICDLCIDDAKLSRQHFAIENDNGKLYITDLQSRNGTMVNGFRISQRSVLNSGDKIFAGLSDIVIQF